MKYEYKVYAEVKVSDRTNKQEKEILREYGFRTCSFKSHAAAQRCWDKMVDFLLERTASGEQRRDWVSAEIGWVKR